MTRLICLAILPALLSGCATGLSSACPPVKQYDRPTLNKAADELEALPPVSVLPGLVADYGVMRAQARRCAGLTL